MKEPYTEGPASHGDPESCVGVREGVGEALTGERIGEVLSREICFRGADRLKQTGRQHLGGRQGELTGDPRGRRPSACADASCTGTGRSHVCPRQGGGVWAVSGRLRSQADDERTWEV